MLNRERGVSADLEAAVVEAARRFVDAQEEAIATGTWDLSEATLQTYGALVAAVAALAVRVGGETK